ncbi:MAG: MFS transporter [Eubacterium sp.]|nr:MFS transporter [Eubacterium sp.]
MENEKRHFHALAILFYISIFLNGFESGGFQATLVSIGDEYGLTTQMEGILASVELFATVFAPLVLGPIADRVGKKRILVLFTFWRAISGGIILLSTGRIGLTIGIFVLGMAVSMVQVSAISGMMDGYPKTNHKRMGLVAVMYALGAVVAPLFVDVMIQTSLGWQGFFVAGLIISLVLTAILWKSDFAPREQGEKEQESEQKNGRLYVLGVLFLCLIMFIYCGVENGVGFFMNEFAAERIAGGDGYVALSLFWLAMIPSRLLSGVLVRYRKAMLVSAPLGAALLLLACSGINTTGALLVFAFATGFFCGVIYPNVLTYASDFAGSRTATVMSAITIATGLGGAIISAAFGFVASWVGFSGTFRVLAAVLAIDVILAIIVVTRKRP